MHDRLAPAEMQALLQVARDAPRALSRLWNTSELRKATMLHARGPVAYANMTCARHIRESSPAHAVVQPSTLLEPGSAHASSRKAKT